MRYADGFLLPVPKKNLKAYFKIAQQAGEVWKEHGALQYCECVGEDLSSKFCLPFTKSVKLKPGETVVLAWIVFKSKAQRDRINKKVMQDPRMSAMCDPNHMPFDPKRMVYGGFEIHVDL